MSDENAASLNHPLTASTRIPLFTPENMTSEQEAVYLDVLAGPRNEVVGPLRAVLHVPELADRWQRLGAFLRYRTSLPERLNELAILVTARRWNSPLEWDIHARAAGKAGLDAEVIDAIRRGSTPEFADAAEREIYEFARSLNHSGNVPEPIYQAVLERWGTTGTVELSSVIGYYTMVAMTLNVHEIPSPGARGPSLPLPESLADGTLPLTTLPAGAVRPRASAEC